MFASSYTYGGRFIILQKSRSSKWKKHPHISAHNVPWKRRREKRDMMVGARMNYESWRSNG
jgi:hypothetical protein